MNETISILIVEDDVVTSNALEGLLASFSSHIKQALSYSAANKLLDKQTYNIIFIDLGLPDKSGIELSKKIRQRMDKNKDSYLIGITAFESPNLQHISVKAGMNCCFLKPISKRDIEHIMVMTGYMITPESQS